MSAGELMNELKSEFTLINNDSFSTDNGRIMEAFGDCYDHKKHSNGRGNILTGHTLYVNCSQYAIVDVDIHVPEVEAIETRELFCAALEDVHVKIVKTRGGGLHIYSLWDESFPMKNGRRTKIYEDPGNYTIDVFTPVGANKASVVLLPGSEAKGSDGKIGRYEWIRKCDDKILSPFADVVKVLEDCEFVSFEKLREENLPEAKEEKVSPPAGQENLPAGQEQEFVQQNKESHCSKELFELIKEGFTTFPKEFHKDRMPVDEEPTIWALFKGAYGCIGDEVSGDDVNDWLDVLRDNLKLTQSAAQSWSVEKKRYRTEDNKGPGMLIQLLKYHHPEFYDTKMKEYYKNHSSTPSINLSDDFNLNVFRRNCANDTYIKPAENEGEPEGINTSKLLRDLHRLLVVVDGQNQLFITKEYDNNIERYVYNIGNYESGKKLLNDINLKGYIKNEKTGKYEHPTVWKIYSMGSNKNSFLKIGIQFYSTNKDIFSAWDGWRWTLRESCDTETIEKWERFVRECVCNGNEELAERLHKYIAYPLQNPGQRNGVAMFLFGQQGSGKTVFADVVSEIYKGFSLGNITDSDHILGRFNSSRENQALIILNESKSSNEGGFGRNKIDMDAIKSPITDRTFQCEEKGMKPRTVINTNNFIITTNHEDSLRLTSDDRRFQIIRVSDKYIKHTEIMEAFWSENWTKELFDNLFTYYMKLDLTNYKRTEIINTQDKDDIIEASKTSYELFVDEYRRYFEDGWVCKDAFVAYVEFCEQNRFKVCASNTFGLKLKPMCERLRKRINGGLEWVYEFKPEQN